MLVGAVAVLIALINSRLRLHPFPALLLVAVVAGLVAGETPADVAESLEGGAGDILGDVGITLALGAMLGRLLADSGATDKIAELVLRRSSPRTLPWLMAGAAFVIGIPMFFEVGLIVLLPLVFSVAQRLVAEGKTTRSPYTLLVIPTVAGLATLHGMVPPHPGPLIAVAGLHADLGKTILVGLACAVPTVILAGPVFGRWLAPRLRIQPDRALINQFTRSAADGRDSGRQATEPSAASPRGDMSPGNTNAKVPVVWAVGAILVPVVLMLLRTLAETTLAGHNGLRAALSLLGQPVVAMLAGLLYALITLAIGRGASGEATRRSLADSLKSIAGILLIIGGGGAFSEVVQDTGISDAVGAAASSIHLGVLLLAWLVALLLSVTTGSATVGIVASTGIVAPLAHTADSWQTALIVVAIGAGSIGLNYVNHGGFWLVKESFGMSMGTAAKTHTTVQTLVSVFGLGMTSLLAAFL